MSGDLKTKKKKFEELFLEQYQAFLSLGVSVCGQREFVKDTLQLFFLQLWEKEIWEADIQDPKAYLFKSFYRLLFSELKKNRKFQGISFDQLEEKGNWLFEREMESLEGTLDLQKKVHKLMKELPEKQRKVLQLRFQEGLAYNEIADFTGKSKQTIYNQIHASIRKLRMLLAENRPPLKKK